jgi:hypothetical protein
MRSIERRVIRVRKSSFGTSVRLSSEMAQRSGIPSASWSATSDGISLIVLAGAASSAFRTGIAA